MHKMMTREAGPELREVFLRNFTLAQHLSRLGDALHSIEKHSPGEQRA